MKFTVLRQNVINYLHFYTMLHFFTDGKFVYFRKYMRLIEKLLLLDFKNDSK
jgi:hypothetical protein